ncbi:MAG: alpha/beta fold hydrolase [Anaerolineae bacterium]
MSAVVVKDGLIHYEVIGRGTPLVFIHGWLGSWRYWMPAMEELSVKYRAYALDLWGFGDSDKLQMHYSVNAYVELLGEFLDKLIMESLRPTLIGHALGGVVALLFAAQAPERVKQVMAVSVPLIGTAINRPLASFSGNGDALARLVARRANFSEVDTESRKTDADAIIHSVRSAMVYDLRDVLPPIKAPVLLVYGGDDPIIKPAQEEWLQDCNDNVHAIFLDSTQHFPMLEERNKFNRLLKDFLDAKGDLRSLKLKEEWQRRLR